MRRRRGHLQALGLAPGAAHQLREDTTTALFILDTLDPMSDEALYGAAGDLIVHLRRLGPDVRAVRRLIRGNRTTDEGD